MTGISLIVPSSPRLRNGEALPVSDVPLTTISAFRAEVVEAVQGGWRLAALFGDEDLEGRLMLWALLADDGHGEIRLARTLLMGDVYPALTPDCLQAHLFEREIAEQFGVRQSGHPWLKPVRTHASWREGHEPWPAPPGGERQPGEAFFHVEGIEAHEVAVGPVHAGVIEPGHFRFQCHGEHVYNLEIVLGYQHRGIEKMLLGGPWRLTPFQMETASGDSTVAHSWAYARTVEALAGVPAPPRGEHLRALALELERLANHAGDLGALAGDVGFLPTASYCGRIRGDFLNLTAELCGSRLGRSLVRPGGVAFDLEPARIARMLTTLSAARRDVAGATDLLWQSPSVLARFERTGVVKAEDARSIGLVGVAARACGLDRDVRRDFRTGSKTGEPLEVALADSGDVSARARVRSKEVELSGAMVEQWLRKLPEGPVRETPGPLAADHVAVSLVEGWRGEVLHFARTNAEGRFARYKIVDPSFHNWLGLALAMRDEQISDFPLCNKSFNLSYCGHDL